MAVGSVVRARARADNRGARPSTTMPAVVSITTADGVGALERHADDIDRLNAASARPTPFSSAAYLRCYALRSEYHVPGQGERLYLVREGGRLIGCAPMRRTHDVLARAAGPLGVGAIRIEFLVPQDNEQPGLLAAPEDEERVAAALLRHLCDQERGWGMVELVGQRPDSPLHRQAHAVAGPLFRVRDVAVEPYNEVALAWPDLHAYYRSLTKHRRSNISRQVRRLYASGSVELVLARGSRATSAWFDAYCDLDDRSWKHGTASSIRRHPRRIRFYRDVVAGQAGLDPAFVGVLLDGVLVAGLITGAGVDVGAGTWCLEMAYDRSRAALGPGQLLLLLAIGEALDRGHRFISFLQNFAGYKHRWGADPIDVVNVQLMRRLSLHNTRASLGDLRRWWRSRRPDQPAGDADDSEESADVGAPVDDGRARALTAQALAQAGPGMRRIDGAAARLHLPFALE